MGASRPDDIATPHDSALQLVRQLERLPARHDMASAMPCWNSRLGEVSLVIFSMLSIKLDWENSARVQGEHTAAPGSTRMWPHLVLSDGCLTFKLSAREFAREASSAQLETSPAPSCGKVASKANASWKARSKSKPGSGPLVERHRLH